MSDSIEWQGDLDDDCTAEWCGMKAHAEAMHDDRWYFDVRNQCNGYPWIHSQKHGFVPNSGAFARWCCEQVMRLVVAERELAAFKETQS